MLPISKLRVFALPRRGHRGIMSCGSSYWPCALGRGGIGASKNEGDGVSPAGVWPMRRLHYRADKMARPVTGLPSAPIRPGDGWCDDLSHPLYNRPVRHPFSASAEHMWREDRLYDLCIELGYNDDPVIRGKGSAIFMHICREGFAPTEGCVAVEPLVMRALLPRLSQKTVVEIAG